MRSELKKAMWNMAKMVQVIAAVREDGFTRLDLSSTFLSQNMGEWLVGTEYPYWCFYVQIRRLDIINAN